ncbi:MAG: ABC transporter ATP-binding protein [Opitutales bacterium]
METRDSDLPLEALTVHCHLGNDAARVHAVKGVNLQLKNKEMAAVTGPSGCGKSSLLYALGLLDHIDSGEIRINGQDTSKLSNEARTQLRMLSIGFVFQFHYLIGEFSAFENVVLPMKKAGILKSKEQEERAGYLLEKVGLADKRSRPGNQLSGGERQRVAIARALANSPKVILADEPTGNLDQENSNRIFSLLREITETTESSVLLVTHNSSLANQADRILTMQDGVLRS